LDETHIISRCFFFFTPNRQPPDTRHLVKKQLPPNDQRVSSVSIKLKSTSQAASSRQHVRAHVEKSKKTIPACLPLLDPTVEKGPEKTD
jgi:hypothetical protein